MTAAVLVAPRTQPDAAPRRPPRVPRLVAVPDCEPPLDEHFDARQRPLAPPPIHSTRPASTPRPATMPGPAPAPTAARRSDVRPVPLAASRPHPAGPTRTAPTTRPSAPCGPTPRPGALPDRSRPPLPSEQDRGRRSFPSPPRIVTVYAGAASGWSDDPMSPAVPTPTAALPAAHAAGTALSRALLEVLSGCRPVAQLRTHCVPGIFAGLPDAPALTADGGCRLLATQVCEPADGVAELAAAFRCGGRVRALAMRLEGIGGRWRITALQVG